MRAAKVSADPAARSNSTNFSTNTNCSCRLFPSAARNRNSKSAVHSPSPTTPGAGLWHSSSESSLSIAAEKLRSARSTAESSDTSTP